MKYSGPRFVIKQSRRVIAIYDVFKKSQIVNQYIIYVNAIYGRCLIAVVSPSPPVKQKQKQNFPSHLGPHYKPRLY